MWSFRLSINRNVLGFLLLSQTLKTRPVFPRRKSLIQDFLALQLIFVWLSVSLNHIYFFLLQTFDVFLKLLQSYAFV